ncbi:hypothetical protein CKM354_001112100 [Cercospora kikuchii]|uniref:Uncharacterized protein n=1 Tax=Cercospora kikuchii TaxID=84275 RepID=A0A9P3FI04_9PEZI|nr:uncharacterized protein CKM354_001112100 [Cercospora kikuchii]GIZ48046.1 hypothetical protein CKM354_001112100 [Cercospora kikuchii]
MNSPYGAPSQAGAPSQSGASSQAGAPSQFGGHPQQGMPPQFGAPSPFGNLSSFGAQSPFGGLASFGGSSGFGGTTQSGGPSSFGGAPSPFGQTGMQQPLHHGPQGRVHTEDVWDNMSDEELLANAEAVRRKWARWGTRLWKATRRVSEAEHRQIMAQSDARFQRAPVLALRINVFEIQLCRRFFELLRGGMDARQAFLLCDHGPGPEGI